MQIDVPIVPVRVPGFRFAGVKCGLKASGKRDVAVIASDVPATAAAAFTTNRVKAAPVRLGLERLVAGQLQAVVVNSGNANAYTGREGLKAAREMCALAAGELGVAERLVVPSSTGRIAVPLPMSKVKKGVQAACRALSPDGFHDALEGIMTTDAFPKYAVDCLTVGGRDVTIAVMAKGAGMIAPQMSVVTGKKERHATLLAYVMTDASVSKAALQRVLQVAQPESFDAIVVDGDTSTNDTVLILANGVAGNRPITPRSSEFPAFCAAVSRLMTRVARMVVKDGEGATRVVDIRVRGARDARDAVRVADSIARSPLCKSAFFGGDPYTGRIVCAAGYSGARFDPDRIDVFFDDVQAVKHGEEIVAKVERRAAAVVAKPEFTLTIDLRAGKATAHRIASDLTVDYVRFNSDYRT